MIGLDDVNFWHANPLYHSSLITFPEPGQHNHRHAHFANGNGTHILYSWPASTLTSNPAYPILSARIPPFTPSDRASLCNIHARDRRCSRRNGWLVNLVPGHGNKLKIHTISDIYIICGVGRFAQNKRRGWDLWCILLKPVPFSTTPKRICKSQWVLLKLFFDSLKTGNRSIWEFEKHITHGKFIQIRIHLQTHG